MYLEHFQLHSEPFGLTPNTDFFCNLPSYQEALNVLCFSISQGAGFIKIVGEVGTGKTLICRQLMNGLAENIYVAYIPNPNLNTESLYYAICRDLGLDTSQVKNNMQLLSLLAENLINWYQQNKKVLIVIDEAQALPDETLEGLRLLSNIETESEKLLQIILFAQPEFDKRLEQMKFRQLQQRIVFSYYLKPLNRTEVAAYINHRLTKAGYTYGDLFNKGALTLLYKKSKGVPRLINNFCYKALLVTYGRGAMQVNAAAVRSAIADGYSKFQRSSYEWNNLFILLGLLVILLAGSMWIYNYLLRGLLS